MELPKLRTVKVRAPTPTQVVEKVNHSSIMNYMNTLFMEIFGGTKEMTVKFIISRYHNGRFYFDRPVEISGEVIYKLTGLSNQGNPVPVNIKEGLVEQLIGTSSGKNSKGLMISQIQARMPQIVAKIIETGLTPTGRKRPKI